MYLDLPLNNHVWQKQTCFCIPSAGYNGAIMSWSEYIWIWSGARDQESTNHSARFVEWKSMYLTNAVIHISVWTLPFLVFSSSSQQSPEYPALHIHAPFIKLPPFKQLIWGQARVIFKFNPPEHVPPHCSVISRRRVLVCLPPTPHIVVQGPHSDQELSWQSTGLSLPQRQVSPTNDMNN